MVQEYKGTFRADIGGDRNTARGAMIDEQKMSFEFEIEKALNYDAETLLRMFRDAIHYDFMNTYYRNIGLSRPTGEEILMQSKRIRVFGEAIIRKMQSNDKRDNR